MKIAQACIKTTHLALMAIMLFGCTDRNSGDGPIKGNTIDENYNPKYYKRPSDDLKFNWQ